ncbi:hypothetical protein QJQ45_023805 [Haematococcus lacustris]|nr:hypothetical protein QJQ45_023805 [Haematococcus lacustris]
MQVLHEKLARADVRRRSREVEPVQSRPVVDPQGPAETALARAQSIKLAAQAKKHCDAATARPLSDVGVEGKMVQEGRHRQVEGPRLPCMQTSLQGLFKFHQYQVTGRHLPTENEPNPTVYRMKVWASDAVRAKSKFWYFLRKLRRVKKANGQILAINEVRAERNHFGLNARCNQGRYEAAGLVLHSSLEHTAADATLGFLQIFERKPTTVKNFGIWVRYQSRTGYHNMYKEFRDVTLNGAVGQLYQEMASRHRVRFPCIQIIKTATVPAAACKRANTQQFLNSKISFPLTRKVVRASRPELKTLYKASRPTVAMY